MKYYINYGTGAGNRAIESDDMDMVKNEADEGIAYTQTSVLIADDDGNEITTRTWVGCESGIEDQEEPIQFGSFGYYTDWS
jgi:hypothetical protein